MIQELLKHRGTEFRWYTQETGGVGCGPGLLTHFGVNTLGLITVYAYDIAKLYPWQQRVWLGHNVPPEGGVSKELLSAQMRTVVAKTRAPEKILEELLEKIDLLFTAATGSPLFRVHIGAEKLRVSVSRFRAIEEHGLFSLAKDLMRLIADRIDVDLLQKLAPPPPKQRWGSLKSLEKYLATLVSPDEARKVMGPLFGVYELRIADAHLPGNDIGEAFTLVGIDPKASRLDQGFTLIDTVAKTIWSIAGIVHRHLLERQQSEDEVPPSS